METREQHNPKTNVLSYFIEFLEDYNLQHEFDLYVEIAERQSWVEKQRALGETVDFNRSK
jgi:hypothetical protein